MDKKVGNYEVRAGQVMEKGSWGKQLIQKKCDHCNPRVLIHNEKAYYYVNQAIIFYCKFTCCPCCHIF